MEILNGKLLSCLAFVNTSVLPGSYGVSRIASHCLLCRLTPLCNRKD
ncbi:hypothetical protein GBAR_LOCUS16177 [Geodia barretti]|uniref:Uncharacterized protein n=1 Tax=Geodia barretti TaxID=519541 RepID=A0AA35WNV9_GEOBA|nr:hypothetical protein GBAR_LOCUS16177 [Geodia barretti]